MALNRNEHAMDSNIILAATGDGWLVQALLRYSPEPAHGTKTNVLHAEQTSPVLMFSMDSGSLLRAYGYW